MFAATPWSPWVSFPRRWRVTPRPSPFTLGWWSGRAARTWPTTSAVSLNNRGLTLWDLGKHAEAIADYDKAVAIYTRWVEEEGREYLAKNFARSLHIRGKALTPPGKSAEALADYDKAVAIYTRLVERDHCTYLRKEMSGNNLKVSGRIKENTAEKYPQTLKLFWPTANGLAMSLNNRGNALRDLGKHAEAIASYDKAVAIYTRLVEEEGGKYLVNHLALSLRTCAEIHLWQSPQDLAPSRLRKAVALVH